MKKIDVYKLIQTGECKHLVCKNCLGLATGNFCFEPVSPSITHFNTPILKKLFIKRLITSTNLLAPITQREVDLCQEIK